MYFSVKIIRKNDKNFINIYYRSYTYYKYYNVYYFHSQFYYNSYFNSHLDMLL